MNSSKIRNIVIGLLLTAGLALLVHALNAPSFIDTSETDFGNGTLHHTKISGSGADANITLNSTTIDTFGVYNLTGNFTSKIFDSNSTESRFDRIKWYGVLHNSSDVFGYAMDTGVGDIGVFYRNGSIGVDTTQADLNSNIAFSGLLAYTLPAGFSKEDIIGFAWDDDATAEVYAFFINGSVATDTSQSGLTADVSFTATSSYTIPTGFNAGNIIEFAIDSDNSQAAVFFKNGSFVQASTENPPFNFNTIRAYTLPANFNSEDAIGVEYDRGANDIAMFFRNESYANNNAQANFGSDITFNSVLLATYPSGFKQIRHTNITLQTRVSNDSTIFTAWSSNYTNFNGSEAIQDNIGRYIQYKAVLETPDKYITPYLMNVTLNYTFADTEKPKTNASINNSNPKINEIVNISANVSDNAILSFCQFITNQSSGAKQFINTSVSGSSAKCSQNFTVSLARTSVINYTVIVNDTKNNKNQSEFIATVANTPAPQPTVLFPSNDLKTSQQPLALNVTFASDPDGDVINISYYINGILNQTSLENATLNVSDGVYILNISLFDNVSGAAPSANITVNFTIDTIKPNTTLSSPANNFNSSSRNVQIVFNATDNIARELNCSISLDSVLNQTNETTLNGTPTTFVLNTLNEGFYIWNITCMDKALNSNTSETRNFTVDLTAPIINSAIFSPNATDDVDPNVLLNFTVNITENLSAVKSVVLQYKQSGAGSFTNDTAQFNSGSGLYNASFTPNIADTWYYRIYAADHAGNNDTSETQSISVQYDRTWKRIPGRFNNLACAFSNTCVAGNLTINNTGDFILNFDLSSNFGSTTFNDTEPFDLAAKEFKVISVSLNAGATASESSVVITTNAVTASADPDQDTANLTFIASAGGPVFDLVILYSPVEVNRSAGQGFHLNASLKNIGNETANYTWINWTLPDNWLNISGNLSMNFSNISVQETVFHNITVNLTSSAATGTKKVNVSAASNNGASDNASASVVVTETGTVTTVTTTTSTGGGGSGGGSGGGGGGSIVQVPAKPELIEISKTVELVRGKENTFTVDVTNTFEGSVLQDLALQVEGFLPQYLAIEPKTITGLSYGQTKSFTVTVSAPSYKSYEEHTLKATVTGMLVKTEYIGNTTAVSKNPFTLKNYISLIIQEISKETADSSLAGAEKLISEMQDSKFPVKKSLKLIQDAKEKLNSRKYKSAEEAGIQIKTIRDNAFSANSLILEIKSKIYSAENKGLQVEETRRLLNLALAAFEREDFTAAIQRAKDAELSIVIETKGKTNIIKFIINYWWPILIVLIALSFISYFARKKLDLVIISRRLQDLQKEEAAINELMQETQEKYYKEKKINTTEYHKAMYGYEKRLSEVSQTISKLRSKRVGIIKISNEIGNLKQEDQNVTGLIKQLQDGYFNKQTVTKKVYMNRSEEYKLRRIEIEKSIAVLEAKLAKKERLEELEAKEIRKEGTNPKIENKNNKDKDNREGQFKKPPIAEPKKKFEFLNLFKRTGEKAERSKEIKGLLDDLIEGKDKPKQVILPRARISTIQRKILGVKFGIKKERDEAQAINSWPIKTSAQKPKEMISMLPKIKIGKIQETHLNGKKEIISKLMDNIKLETIKPEMHKKPKPKEYKKHFPEDGDALRKHGFKIKIPGEKEPEAKYIMPKPGSHTKHSIISHFKEAYKNG